MKTDCDFLLGELRRGPCCAMDVISASIRERGTGLTVHSRVADLRERGYEITCAIEGKTRAGREKYVYRLVSEPAASREPECGVGSPSVVEQDVLVSVPAATLGGEQLELIA